MEQITTTTQMNTKNIGFYEDKLSLKKKIFPMFNDSARKSMIQKDQKKTFKYVLNKIRLKKCASATISKPFPIYNVAYLGNVVTGWAKGDGCIEKPLTTLWRNYIQSSRPDVNMQLTVSGGGLKAITKNHGLTEYWAHRLTICAAPPEFPRVFCWVYRHEGRRMRHELRCHAVLCVSVEIAKQIEKELKDFLRLALNEFKKEKLSRQNARLSLVNSINENASLPKRKILLGIGAHNYRPPLECSKSAPKLSSIEEIFDEEEGDTDYPISQQIYRNILKSYERNNFLYERVKYYSRKKLILDKMNKSTEESLNNEKIIEEEEESKKCDDRVKFPEAIIKNNSEQADKQNEDNNNTKENNNDQIIKLESDKKVDIEFKIGGEIQSLAIKNLDKIIPPSIIDHAFVNNNPMISNKGILDQEQVSLVPVGETQMDFSSLKVYKKRNCLEGGKDLNNCAMFLSGNENIGQLDQIFQTNCSFNGDRFEDEIINKINSTLVV